MSSHSPKTALVTGASSGIGRASAEAPARAGFTVFGTSRKPGGTAPSEVTMLACDVTDDASVAALVSQVLARTGRIDVLVNNAGVGMFGGAEESSVARVQRLYDVNLFGVVRLINAVLPSMLVATRYLEEEAKELRQELARVHIQARPSRHQTSGGGLDDRDVDNGAVTGTTAIDF